MNKTKYRASYCQDVIEHMANGNTLKSFAGHISVTEKTVHNWCKRYPAFGEAKQVGEAKREMFMLNVGKMMYSGQLKRVVREESVIGPDGRPALDGRGRAIMNREYAYVPGNAAVWIFMMKNYGWRDERGVKIGGDPHNPLRHEFDSMDNGQLVTEAERYRAMRVIATEDIPDGGNIGLAEDD